MYALHYKQHLCLNWSIIFHCVHIYNTLEGEEKSAIIKLFPLWSEEGGQLPPFRVKGSKFQPPTASPEKLNSAVLYKENVKSSLM